MRSVHSMLLSGASALAICSVVSSGALADGSNIETVVVTGVRGSLRDSLAAKNSWISTPAARSFREELQPMSGSLYDERAYRLLR